MSNTEIGKNNHTLERVESVIWAADEDNPDYKLITINAANSGFISKMSSENGSYVITKFIDRLAQNYTQDNNKEFLVNILGSIQDERSADIY